MKKLDNNTIKIILLTAGLLALAVAFSIIFRGGWWSLTLVLSPMISLVAALIINDHIMRKKYNLEKEKDSFRYKGEEELLPYEEVLKRKHESDKRCIIIFFCINIVLLGLMIIGAKL